MTPEEKARQLIDAMLKASGWEVQSKDEINLSAARGVAIRELSVKTGEPDYTLFADAKAIATVEAKPEGESLTGVEEQSTKYVTGVPFKLPAWKSPLPFCYESTGAETFFTNRLDPHPRSRRVFCFHRPETLIEWVQREKQTAQRLQEFPPLANNSLWAAQVQAITNLEKSFAADRPRALIQMATGSGKTYTAVNFIYRLVKYAGAKRVLFLVDRGNLGDQTLKEFQQFVSPVNNYKFTEEYIVQRLSSNTLDTSARVVIGTIQRIYSMLKGETEPAPDLDDLPIEAAETLFKKPVPVEYNPSFPIEEFDFIITDECHRSIYNLWRQVLDYFDASLIGLTATPSKQTFGFFKQNLVMEYNHEKAVADGVNVGCDIYRINTAITQGGSTVDAGYYVDKRDRQTRKIRWEQLDDPLAYDSADLDRDVVSPDQIRTVLATFRDKVFTEMFPGRADLPKTLIFAKDDTHADDIVRICREVFDKGNDFCQKITYRTGFTRTEEIVTDKQGNIQKDAKGEPVKKSVWVKTSSLTPEQILSAFRNSYSPRIAVTVDMIATGTDIKPLEIVFFMRSVGSKNFFDQMKGRGVRVVSETEMENVNPGVKRKTRFMVVDAVGVCERVKTETRPLEKKPNVSFEKLLDAAALGTTEVEAVESLAGRLIRLERRLDDEVKSQVVSTAKGQTLSEISKGMLAAIDPDEILAQAKQGKPEYAEPTQKEIESVREKRIKEALTPLAANPDLRNLLKKIAKAAEQTIDVVSQDTLLYAGPAQKTTQDGAQLATSFREYIEQHKAEITALQILYSRPYKQRLTESMLKELEKKLREQHAGWTEDNLWNAFAAARPGKVIGRSQAGRFADLVSLVRFSLEQQPVLEPFAESVTERFNEWLMDTRLCAMNLLLHGIGSESDLPIGNDGLPVVTKDALAGKHGEYEIVLANPPFGKKSSVTIVNEAGEQEKESLVINRDDFWASTSNKQLNFLQHIFTILKQHGRAAVVLPDNVLFEGGAGETIRRALLKQADVHTLLRLPTGIFYAQGVKANVLFFDRKPAQEKPWTEKLWIYDLRTNKHFTLKENTLQRTDLDDFVTCYNPKNRHQRKESERFKGFTYEELLKRDKVNLDIFWLKDEALEESANLPAPEIIAQEITDDLEAALEQFATIAEDLKK